MQAQAARSLNRSRNGGTYSHRRARSRAGRVCVSRPPTSNAGSSPRRSDLV